ncbi:MAG: terminase large subunit [Streptomyces sp.]|nr:terminase large subunit [Streptomyces sp.]
MLLAPHAPANAASGTFIWDQAAADRVVAFFERVLVHTKGRHARTPFLLTDWQKDEIVRPLFGTLAYDEQYDEYVRQYRVAWLEMARKNGKSELASGFALYGLVGDGEESAEVYSVAADRDQASLVFDVAKRMVELSPVLSRRLEVVASKKRIIDPATNSFYAVLPGDASGALGTNPSMVLFDEVLTQKDRHLWDAMRQGFGTRRQPILIATTTAAYTSARFALEEHEYGEGLLNNPAADAARFVFMRNTPRDWDWRDEGHPANPETGEPATGWYHANPALGDFLSIGNLRSEAVEAESKPSAENAFRVFRLNQWTSQAERWLDMQTWDRNGETPVLREHLAGRCCYAGLDLASVSDFTAWVLLFPGSPEDKDAEGFTILPRFWIPSKALKARGVQRSTLEYWAQMGWLTITDGDVTDYRVVQAEIEKDAEDFCIDLFGYDPWNATNLVTELEDGGLEGVKAPQTSARMTDPCKWMETLLAEGVLRHGGNPVLRWMADNVEIQYTGDGLFKPSKAKSGDKIDGISALLNALFVAFTEDDTEVGFISLEDD